jgi:hypothetical protein
MARRQLSVEVLAEHLHQLLFAAGFMGKQAGRGAPISI